MEELPIYTTIEKVVENFRMSPNQELYLEFAFLGQIDPPSLIEKLKRLLVFAEKRFPILTSAIKSNDLSKESRSRGNEEWIRNKNKEKAMCFYNVAIGQAEQSSEELAFAFANRSAINFEMNRFKDVIADVDRALALDYPQRLKFKLFERKAKSLVKLQKFTAAIRVYTEWLELAHSLGSCSDKLRADITFAIASIMHNTDFVEQEMSFPKLTHPPSKTIYCASEAIKVNASPSWGRMVVATVDLKPGDVLVVEKAYSSGLIEICSQVYCHDCKKKCYSMIPCLKCTQVFYCDELCRSRSWETEHMIECDMMPTINAVGRDKDLCFSVALKMLLKMTDQGKKLKHFVGNQQKYSSCCSPFQGFKNNQYCANKSAIMNIHFQKDLPNEEMNIMVLHSCLLVLALKKTHFFDYVNKGKEMDLTVGLLLTKLILQSKANLIGVGTPIIVNEEHFYSRAAIGPFMTLINHSCDPNAQVVDMLGDTFLLFAVDIIPRDHQIFISYGPRVIEIPKVFRGLALERKGFECKCQACVENWPPYEQMPNAQPPSANEAAYIMGKRVLLSKVATYLKAKSYDRKKMQAFGESLGAFLMSYRNNPNAPNPPDPLVIKAKHLLSSILVSLGEMNALKF